MECKKCLSPTRLINNSEDRAVCTLSLCRQRQSIFKNTIFSARGNKNHRLLVEWLLNEEHRVFLKNSKKNNKKNDKRSGVQTHSQLLFKVWKDRG